MLFPSNVPFLRGRISRATLGKRLFQALGSMVLLAFFLSWLDAAFPASARLHAVTGFISHAFACWVWAYVPSLFVRRFHDSGKSGIWVPVFVTLFALTIYFCETHPLLAYLFGIPAYLVALEYVFDKTDQRENLYGPVPA